MIQSVMTFFEMFQIVPIIMGLYRVSRIQKENTLMLIYLIVGFIFYNLFWLKIPVEFMIIIQYGSSVILFFLIYCFLIAKLQPVHFTKIIITLGIFVSLSAFFDYRWQEGKLVKTMWFTILNGLLISLLALKVLSKIIINSIIPFYKNPEVLLIGPLVVFYIYFSVLLIFMHFMFNDHTMAFFKNAYSIVNLLNFISYISYSLAFLWLPKKEVYL